MKSLIVEKTVVLLDGNTDYFAVVTQEPTIHSTTRSLTFEGYLTPWNSNRREVEALQRKIE